MSPSCVKCGEFYDPRRKALGYHTCLDCGSPLFRPPIIPVAKSNYIVGSMEELRDGSQSHKGMSNYK